MALYSAENMTLRKIGQKYLESFEIWCWRMEISWADSVRNEVSQRVKRTGISCKEYKEGRLSGLVTSCVGTAV
jgi:hypothetical protein